MQPISKSYRHLAIMVLLSVNGGILYLENILFHLLPFAPESK